MKNPKLTDGGSPRQHRRHMRRLKREQSGAPDLGGRNTPPERKSIGS